MKIEIDTIADSYGSWKVMQYFVEKVYQERIERMNKEKAEEVKWGTGDSRLQERR